VRFGREKLDDEIKEIFGDESKTKEGQEKEISLSEYLEKVRKKKDFRERKRLELERKTVQPPKNDDEFY